MKILASLIACTALLGAVHTGAAAPVITDNEEFSVNYLGKSTSGDLVTFTWQVCKLGPAPAVKGLSHAVFGLAFPCIEEWGLEDIVVGGTVTDHGGTPQPAALVFGFDSTTGVTGVKFDELDLDDAEGACYLFTLTLDGSLLPQGMVFGEGAVTFATKAGNQSVSGGRDGIRGLATVSGPVCMEDEDPLEGLSPGYWKNHLSAWPAPYGASSTVGGVGFSGTMYQSDTLLTALNYGGGTGVAGAQRILLRAAAAALLNAADPEINFPLTVAQVLSQVNTAISTGTRAPMLTLADTLDGYNNLGVSN